MAKICPQCQQPMPEQQGMPMQNFAPALPMGAKDNIGQQMPLPDRGSMMPEGGLSPYMPPPTAPPPGQMPDMGDGGMMQKRQDLGLRNRRMY